MDELTEWKARSERTGRSDPMFVTRSGRRQTVTNIDHRIKAAIKVANRRLDGLGIEPIPNRVSPHSLRRTYASLRGALRDDPVYIAEQLGHTDPGFTFRVYQKAAKRRERLSGEYRQQFDAALHWAQMGTNRDFEPFPTRSVNSAGVEDPP
jgi:integrase